MSRFSPPWLAYILGERINQISLNDKAITVSNRNGVISTYRWSDIQSVPDIRSGIIFAKVYFEVDGQIIELPSLFKRSAHKLQVGIVNRVFADNAEKAQRACLHIERHLFRKGYLRTSQVKKISRFATAQLAKLVRPSNKVTLKPDTQRPFKQLSSWAEEDTSVISKLRHEYVEIQLKKFGALFDKVESNPLTERQRRACVIDEDNNLVLAGAGTGKTSTMVGRAAYLIESGQAKASEILMLAYGNTAAKEMQGRIAERIPGSSVEATTFHALGRKLLAKVEGTPPNVSPLATDKDLLIKTVDTWFHKYLAEPVYRTKTIQYFSEHLYPAKNEFDFPSLGAYFDYIRENRIRTLKSEEVKSLEECLIANWLFRMGVNYEYESPYHATETRTPDFRAYLPDFYLPDYGIYIEHFGVDRQNRPAPYIDPRAYLEGMEWKRELHATHETTLIETFSYEQKEGTLLQGLERKLSNCGVEFDPLPDEAVLETLKEFGAITRFSELLCDLLNAYKASNESWASLAKRASRCANPTQFTAAMELLHPIVKQYENHLSINETVDFNDMIGRAIRYVENGQYTPQWRFIMVDEFQDISLPRTKLVLVLRDKASFPCSTFCVGDDWQAIFRFAGSDVTLTTGFEKQFGPTQITALDKTFRFDNKLSDVASTFVMQNPSQVRKTIRTHSTASKPSISIARRSPHQNGDEAALKEILEAISTRAKSGATVYLLARFTFKLPRNQELKNFQEHFPKLKISCLTFHRSKGKEADFVVLLGLEKGEFGCPSSKETHPLLEALLPAVEPYPFAEERRLFYVAITRAKRRAYLLCDMTKASMFVTELIDGDYDVDLEEFTADKTQLFAASLTCSDCKTGQITQRRKNGKAFYGCSNYPLCEYTQPGCKGCGGPMSTEGRYRVCVDYECPCWEPLCLKCGAPMKHRNGPHGRFWSCSRWKPSKTGCDHKEERIAPPHRSPK